MSPDVSEVFDLSKNKLSGGIPEKFMDFTGTIRLGKNDELWVQCFLKQLFVQLTHLPITFAGRVMLLLDFAIVVRLMYEIEQVSTIWFLTWLCCYLLNSDSNVFDLKYDAIFCPPERNALKEFFDDGG